MEKYKEGDVYYYKSQFLKKRNDPPHYHIVVKNTYYTLKLWKTIKTKI